MTTQRSMALALGLGLLMSLPVAVGAQIAVSGNDNKVVNVNGVTTNPPPDTVSIIDLKASPCSSGTARA
jgi:hypothetical protein